MSEESVADSGGVRQNPKGIPSGVLYGLGAAFGAVFLITGIGKIMDPIRFKEVVYSYQLEFLADPFPAIVAISLPWLEIFCGFALICGVFRGGSLLILNVALVAFTVVKVYNWQRGVEVDCGCSGVFRFLEFGIPETVGLLVLGLFIALATKFEKVPNPAPVEAA